MLWRMRRAPCSRRGSPPGWDEHVSGIDADPSFKLLDIPVGGEGRKGSHGMPGVRVSAPASEGNAGATIGAGPRLCQSVARALPRISQRIVLPSTPRATRSLVRDSSAESAYSMSSIAAPLGLQA